MIFECKVIKTVEIGLHTEFIGEILDVKAHESVLDENNIIDVRKVRPLIWSLPNMSYRNVGKHLEKSFSIGKKLRESKNAETK